MDVELPLLGEVEDLQHLERLLGEQLGLVEPDPAAVDREAVDPAPAKAEAGQGDHRPALVPLLECRAHHPGQGADVAGDEVVALHEALDRA